MAASVTAARTPRVHHSVSSFGSHPPARPGMRKKRRSLKPLADPRAIFPTLQNDTLCGPGDPIDFAGAARLNPGLPRAAAGDSKTAGGPGALLQLQANRFEARR